MTAIRPNRVTHADTDTDDAIDAYIAHRDEPIMEPAPTLEQIRLIAQVCQEFCELPFYPSEEFLGLRRRVIHIKTLDDLARWLWDCRKIGIEPL